MRGEGRGEKFKGECVPSGKFLLDARPARTIFPTVDAAYFPLSVARVKGGREARQDIDLRLG